MVEDGKTARGVVLHNIQADGTPIRSVVRPYAVTDFSTGRPYLDEAGAPLAVIQVRLLPRSRFLEIVRAHTHRVFDGRPGQWREEYDDEAATDAMTEEVIVDWTGLYGADVQPLACTPETKRALNYARKKDLINFALQTETVEAVEASFRAIA